MAENTNRQILFLVNGLDIGHTHGGAEKFACELAISLQNAGWQIHLALLSRVDSPVEQEWRHRLEAAGVRLVFLGTGKKRNPVNGLAKAARYCQENRITLAHSHCQIGSVIVVGLRILGRVQHTVRTMYVSQEWGSSTIAWLLRTVFSYWIFPLVFSTQVAVSQTISKRSSAFPGAVLSGKRTKYIPNIISDTWFENLTRNLADQKPCPERPIIGNVGVLNARKGQRFLIEAFAIVLETWSKSQLWLIGDGPDRQTLEGLANQLGIAENVRFWGQRQDVQTLLDQMDLFVLSSFVEGLPISVLEGMARGVPVIATDIPGNRELVEDGVTGRLVPPGNAPALAKCMLTALQEPEASLRMANEARERMNRFSQKAVTEQHIQIYHTLLR